MKTVFDQSSCNALIARINLLNDHSAAQWGKMNVYQMLKHCILCDEMYLGKTGYKRSFIGRIFGKMALKGNLKDDSPLRRSTPTLPEFIITDTTGDLEALKKQWVDLVAEYALYTQPEFLHPFFGKMTRDQLGYVAYKHIDHHLRQFNA